MAATTTAGDGAYAFTDLAAGEYTVIAGVYPPVAQSVALGGSGGLGFDVTLVHLDDREDRKSVV